MFSLLLITYDFPYGQGETFLETEIKYASQHFPIVYILSTSRNKNLTRELPSNVKAFKIDRCYHFIGCLLYSISKCFSQEARNEFRDVKHLRIKPNKLKMIKSWIITWMIEKRLAIAIKELHFDLHNIIGYSYWLSASAYYLSKETSFRYTFSRAHRFEVRDYEEYIPFRSYVDAHLNEIVFISEYTRDEYNSIVFPILSGNTRAKQVISRLGIEQHDILDNHQTEDGDTLLLLSCSTISYLKRLDLIIEALALVSESKRIKWVHIGWGEKADEIVSLCRRVLGSKRNISYAFLGAKSNKEVIEYYFKNPVNLFINVSDNEGIPVSIMEAMSFGIPCIGRRVGGNPEIIQEGVSGYLLNEDTTPSEIARLIEKFVDDKSYRISSSSVLAFFEQNFLASYNYEEFYKHIINELTVR